MVVHIASSEFQLDNAVDLRRKRTRDMAETVADNAQWALPDERAIIQAIYRDGLTAQQVAHLRSESPRRVRARVRRIVARLVSERFRFVVRSRDQWPVARRRVASACVLQGMSMREAARFLQLTLHQVRREMSVVQALLAQETPGPTPPSRPTPPSGPPRKSGGAMVVSHVRRAADRADGPAGIVSAARLDVARPVFGAPALSGVGAGIACALGVVRGDLRAPMLDPASLAIDVSPGALTLITGPSGCGKSSFVRALMAAARGNGMAVVPTSARVALDRPVCDLIAREPMEAMRALASAGLGDVRAMVRPMRHLSEGQRSRARIAIALVRARRISDAGGKAIVVIDEFASDLDAATARSVAHLLHTSVRREPRFACVVATPRADVIRHLAPARTIAMDARGRAEVRTAREGVRAARVRVRIRKGTREQYESLASLHYRPGAPATMERILIAADAESGLLAGVLVVSRPILNAAWRELAWPSRYTRGCPRVLAARINREVRCISRVIVDPRFRAMGVALKLVRAYLRDPLTVNTEALAAMGQASDAGGFFARAGMTAYRTAPREADARVLDALEHLGWDRACLADPGGLARRCGRGADGRFLEREVRRWASASGRTRAWRDAPLEQLIERAARTIASTPIAYAHTTMPERTRARAA